MVLAYDYPLLSIMWTIFVIFLWVAWIILLVRVFGDIFRRDMSGLSKAVWSILVILLPYLGVFAYLVVNGGGMVERVVAVDLPALTDLEGAKAMGDYQVEAMQQPERHELPAGTVPDAGDEHGQHGRVGHQYDKGAQAHLAATRQRFARRHA